MNWSVNWIRTDTQQELADTHEIFTFTGIPGCNSIGELKSRYVTADTFRNNQYLKLWHSHRHTVKPQYLELVDCFVFRLVLFDAQQLKQLIIYKLSYGTQYSNEYFLVCQAAFFFC